MLGEANPFRDSGMSASLSSLLFSIEDCRSQWTCHTEHGRRHKSRVFIVFTTTSRLMARIVGGGIHVSLERNSYA